MAEETAASRLSQVNLQYRTCSIAKNDYDNNNAYSVTHSDALSNGDELGKGELNGIIGGATDIKTRETLIPKNKYNKNREYNASTA